MSQAKLSVNVSGASVPARQSARANSSCATPPRRLQDDDRGRVLAHLRRLSADDRRMRFCRAFSDANVEHYVANINFETSACFGIFDADAELIALVQTFNYDEHGVRMLEAAFSTDAAERGRGLGTLLFQRVAEHAAEQQTDRVIAQCLAWNRPMRALLRAVGAVSDVDGDEVTGQLEIAGHA